MISAVLFLTELNKLLHKYVHHRKDTFFQGKIILLFRLFNSLSESIQVI